jgi:hypothetical protein
MAYQKTDGTLQDRDYIVGRLKEGFSFDEAIQGMKMPIDPGTPERPGWCYRNKQLLLDIASGKVAIVNPGLTTVQKRVVGYATTPDGKVWAIHPDNTRTEVKAAAGESTTPAPQTALVAEAVAMDEADVPKAAKKSRRKAAEKPKEW